VVSRVRCQKGKMNRRSEKSCKPALNIITKKSLKCPLKRAQGGINEGNIKWVLRHQKKVE